MFVGTVSVEFWAWVFEAVASGVKSVVTIHFFIFICIWFIFNFLFVFIIITSSAEGLIQRRLKWKLGIGRYWVGLSFLWFLFRVFSKSGRATEVVGDSDSGFFFVFCVRMVRFGFGESVQNAYILHIVQIACILTRYYERIDWECSEPEVERGAKNIKRKREHHWINQKNMTRYTVQVQVRLQLRLQLQLK